MSRIAFIVAVCVGMASLSALAQGQSALTEYQQKIADEVASALDSVEAGLVEARAKLEAGDVSAATGAYNTAVRNYNNNIRRLGQLPAEHPTVSPLRERAAALGASIKEVGAAIKSGPAPQAPGAKPSAGAPAPAAPSSKLDYRQEEKLKNARYYLKEVEPRAERIFELTAGTLDAEAIAEALEQMKFVRQRLALVVENLNTLPGENAAVAAESQKYNALLEKLVAAQETIEKAAPEADKQMAALRQQMEDDLAMVESWSASLGDPQALFNNRPDDAIAVVGQLPQMRQALGAMQQRWTSRATAKPNDRAAGDMVRKLKYVDGNLAQLETYTRDLATNLPTRIGADLEQVNRLIETAVTEKRPAYFGPDGGIAQQFGFAEQRLKLLQAIDPAAAAQSETLVASTRAKSRAAQESLAQDIINANKRPPERYTGADVEDLRKRVIAAWKEAHPNDEVVAVVFNTEGWSRTTRWDWSKGNQAFSKVDYDYIQPKLFYKLDDTRAVQVPVEIYKDYMKDQRLVIKPWEKEAEPSVTSIYLLQNLR